MSEPMQAPVSRPPRAERTTTSCGECRRRKQKCNQSQPCSNCARRFPQPLCEYKPSSRSKLRRPSAVAIPQRPTFTLSVFPPTVPGNQGFDPVVVQQSPLHQPSPALTSPWSHRGSEGLGDALTSWPGFDVLGQSPTPTSPGQYAWSTDQSSISMCIIACEEGCTSHSDDVHDAIKILRAYRPTSSHWTSNTWSPRGFAWTLAPAMPPGVGGIPWPVADPTPELAHLPVAQPMQNSDLLSIYVKFLAQFKASLDGKPDVSNPFIKYYVPYCVNSQLLVHVAIYTAACFLTDTGHVERTSAMAHKGHVIKLLNEHIRSQLSTSDEAIAGVVQLIVVEWLWGNTNDLRAHLRGLREMIRFRGGFRTLGLHGLISKQAITSDFAIALSFEVSPFLRGGSEFEFRDSSQIPLRLALNTPFISTLVPFASCGDALHIHTAVTSILDDIRFLLAAVLALPEQATAKQLQKVHTTSAWIHERISSLPADAPAAPRLSAAASPAPSPAASSTLGREASPETGEIQQQYHPSGGRSRGPRQQHQNPRRLSAQAIIGEVIQDQREATQAPAPSLPLPIASAPEAAPDYIYQTVRLAALLYTRAIMQRRSFSLIVTPAEFHQLWTTAWRVPLSTWRSLLGVFNWILLPIVSSGRATPHDRFVKGMMNVSLLQIGMDNWEIARCVMEAALRLQRWLAAEIRDSASPPQGADGGCETTKQWEGYGRASSFGGDSGEDGRDGVARTLSEEGGGGERRGKGKGKDNAVAC